MIVLLIALFCWFSLLVLLVGLRAHATRGRPLPAPRAKLRSEQLGALKARSARSAGGSLLAAGPRH